MKRYLQVASVVFLLVSLAHLARLITGAPLIIDQWHTPMWVSVVGVIVPGYLSIVGFCYAKKTH